MPDDSTVHRGQERLTGLSPLRRFDLNVQHEEAMRQTQDQRKPMGKGVGFWIGPFHRLLRICSVLLGHQSCTSVSTSAQW